jgi:hypothetical protein
MAFFDFLDPSAASLPLQSYAPSGMGSAESNILGGISNLGQYNQYLPNIGQAQNITAGMVGDPSAQGFRQGAQFAGGMGQQAAQNQFGAGGDLYGYGGAIANAAFDPRQALYNRSLQQFTDQMRAGQGARGIAMTPYGAGLEAMGLGNFANDWQNQQLQRMLQGGQGMSNMYGQGAQMQASAPGMYLGASGMPWMTGQQIGGAQMGALGGLGQFGQAGAQLPQQQIQDWQNYLGWGSNQQNANNQTMLNQEKLASQQSGDMWSGLGKLAGTAAPFLMSMLSDENLKDDISQVGVLYDDTPVYSFRYAGDPTPRIGLMAQDVEERYPEAVGEAYGFKTVDYGLATARARELGGLSSLGSW